MNDQSVHAVWRWRHDPTALAHPLARVVPQGHPRAQR